jgi:RNA polymerase sigma-70 factor (ECF subfamily)
MLRSRKSRREESLDTHVPDPVVSPASGVDPEHEALLADSVGLALLVVLNTLDPAERLAFILHDMFAMPFDEIAPVVGRTPAAARQLASRARRRVQGAEPAPHADLDQQRTAVEAFLAASRGGDFEALVAALDPDVTLRVDYGAKLPGKFVRGAREVAGNALTYSRYSPYSRLALVNGALGVVTMVDGKAFSVMGVTVRNGVVAEIYILADLERLEHLDLTFFND